MSLEPADHRATTVAEAVRPHLALRIESSPISVRAALIRIRAALAQLGLDAEAAGSVELVLAEVLNNIGEHAYRGMDAGIIELGIWSDGDLLLFRTRDTGIPMPDGDLPTGRPVAVDRPAEDVPEGGFGWYLIRTLTADLNYSRAGNSNQLSFRMRRDARPFDI